MESNKRRKTCSLCITDLHDSVLTDIVSFLPKENRALLAVALTASASSWQKCHWSQAPSSISKVVLSMHEENGRKEWENLDFKDLQKSAWKYGHWPPHGPPLNDIDLKAILVCIDAATNLKSLKLTTGCFNISGHGLEPLRDSLVLKSIDLSLVKEHRSPSLGRETAISLAAVLPILDSIVVKEGQSLMHIQLPLAWRTEKSPCLSQFLAKYNRALRETAVVCSHAEWDQNTKKFIKTNCNNISEMGMHLDGDRYGIQTGTCYKCTKHFCLDFDDCQKWDHAFDYCPKCQKYYCNECTHVWDCDNGKCSKSSCDECGEVVFCDLCMERPLCYDCGDLSFTECCEKIVCGDCRYDRGRPCCEWNHYF
ncbi:hypothetical protein ACHAXR_011621 [Thalassiosira sp. AJA248-18]